MPRDAMLEAEEIAARIRAARALRGLSQDELAQRVSEEGLPWRLVGALERCEAPLRAAHRAVLAEVLDMPERWFTESLSDLWDTRAGIERRLGVIEELLRGRPS